MPDTMAILPSRTRSLSRRMVMATLLFATLVSIAVTALQLVVTRREDTRALHARIDEIGTSVVPSLAASMWLVDSARTDLLLDSVAQIPGVVHVRVTSTDGDLLTRGDAAAPVLERRTFALRHREGTMFDVGTLDVAISDHQILAGLLQRALQRMLTLAVGLGGGALLLLLLFRHWVTRHLATMADYAQRMSLETLDTPLVLPGKRAHATPDELDQVVMSFNRMRKTMLDDLETRRRYEAELTAHRERLEELVGERTRELEAQRDAVQRLANTDHLTGVSSRRHLYECADRELTRCRRDDRPMALLMLDIDHFKKINDAHGHAIGDVVLKAFARTCQQQLREADCFGRLGGEEFAVVLSGMNGSQAAAVAEHVRQALSQVRINLPGGQVLQFTVSIGIGVLTSADHGVDTVLKRADDALYQAKREGRNRFVLEATPA